MMLHRLPGRLRRSFAAALVLGTAFGPMLAQPATTIASALPPPATALALAFNDGDCGPPSTSIPGPPPELIVVGQPMNDSWLLCYMKRDLEGQTFSFDHWGDVRKTAFRGYPVECWNAETDSGAAGRRTDGIVAEMYGWNLDHTQYVRFTYRIQLDGDYINNCQQEILPTP
jgi:hypothetical protein